MAPHTRFKLAVIRTMRCDFCNKGNVDGLQECVDCNMHICRECVETGKLNNDEKHRMEQDVIDNLDWKKALRPRRATHGRTNSTSESNSSPPAAPSNQERRQTKAERRRRQQQQQQSDHDTGTYYESEPQFRNIRPRIPQNMDMFYGGGFNIPAGNHGHTGDVHGHGNFPFGPAPPGLPPGYNPSFPAHMMPPGVLPFVAGPPGQPGQPANQGGLAMPMGPMFGHHFSANSGLPPRGDPRLNTPPGPQFAHSGYPVPNNFGHFQGGQPLGFSPAPTPPGFPGPGFHQHAPQPPGLYNERGYVPQGNMPPGQPVPGPFPFTGQPYGASSFPFASQPPPQQQVHPRGQAGEPPTQGGQAPSFSELAREFQARRSAPHGHAEQSDSLSNNEQKQREHNPWERGQHSSLQEEPSKEIENTRQPWAAGPSARELSRNGPYRSQDLLDLQRGGGQVQQQPRTQRDFQPLVQQPQRQVREQREAQPVAQEKSQNAQQAQKQNEQRQEKPEGQRAKPDAGRPIPETVVVSGLPPITSSHIDASHITLPPIINPLVTASSVFEGQTPDSARPQPLPTLEPDPNTELPRLQLGEAHATTPSVVDHAQRPFGIPALTRDLFAGRPNHYDETTTRWAELARARRPSPDDDYDYDDSDDDVSETGGDIDKGKGKEPAHAVPPTSEGLPGRGRKRTFSQASSAVDSTLSAELDQPFTPAATTVVVPGTESLRRDLQDDATIGRVRHVDGERAALDMAAAANTLQGGGRGLGGVADAQVIANDREIRRRQDQYSRRQGASIVVLKEEKNMHRPGGDGGGGSGRGSGNGGSARGRGRGS